MMTRRSFFLLGLVLLTALSGCGPKGMPIVPDSDAAARWQAFKDRSARPASYDVLSGSLRFGPVNDTRRVTYLLWSAATAGPDVQDHQGPAGLDDAERNPGFSDDERTIRLEVNAGVGANVAKAVFENGQMLLVLPRDEKAYAGTETPDTLRRLLGLPLPMRMNRLNDFLAGRYLSALDVPAPERYLTGGDGNIIYSYRSHGRSCELELNADALPVRWTIDGRWSLNLAYDDKGLPRRLDGKMDSDGSEMRMVLLVKERLPSGSVPESGMELEVPANFAVYSLDQ